MKKYSRVSYEDRCQISAMLKRNFSVPEISKELGFHKSSIYREIKRNTDFPPMGFYVGYYPMVAESLVKKRSLKRRKKLLIKDQLLHFVTNKLKEGWSPEKIAGRYKRETKKSLSHQTIYRFTYANPEYKKMLRFGHKRGIGRRKQKKVREDNLMSIRQRPKSANNRTRYGHWERDGMYGANRKQLLVCIERKSRFVRLGRMENGDAQFVSKLTEDLLKDEKVLTITNDNGSEFRRPQTCKFPIYYCDPMKPNQRGSVENVIGSLRRLVKRTTDLDALENDKIKEIENYINNTPRKLFDYQTPYEVYYKKKVALAKLI